jgi:hypothetical protein
MVYKFEIKQTYSPIYYSCPNVEERVLTVWLFELFTAVKIKCTAFEDWHLCLSKRAVMLTSDMMSS